MYIRFIKEIEAGNRLKEVPKSDTLEADRTIAEVYFDGNVMFYEVDINIEATTVLDWFLGGFDGDHTGVFCVVRGKDAWDDDVAEYEC